MSQYTADVDMLTTNDSGVRKTAPSIIVIHTNQGPGDGKVEDLLAWLQKKEARASYTMVVNRAGRTGRSNDDEYVPWAAGSPANERGLHLCLMGYAEQTREEWLKQGDQLAAAADVAADWCRRYNIDPRWITGAQMKDGVRGIGGHDTTVAAWGSTDHWDPGPGFPRDHFIALVAARLAGTPDTEDTMDHFTAEDRAMLREVHAALLGPRQSLINGDKAFDTPTFIQLIDASTFRTEGKLDDAIALMKQAGR